MSDRSDGHSRNDPNLITVRYSERPDLLDRAASLSAEVWPEYNLHGDVLNEYWSRLYKEFPDFQFGLYDVEHDGSWLRHTPSHCFGTGRRSDWGPESMPR